MVSRAYAQVNTNTSTGVHQYMAVRSWQIARSTVSDRGLLIIC